MLESTTTADINHPGAPASSEPAVTPETRTVWDRGKTPLKRLLGTAPLEMCTTHGPACCIPYEIVEMITTHLIRHLLTLKACSLTCRSWYSAAASLLHHTLTLTKDNYEFDGGQPALLSKIHELGLKPLVKEIRTAASGSVTWTCAPTLFEMCAETLETVRLDAADGFISPPFPEFDLSRLKVLRSFQVGAWVANFSVTRHRHTFVSETFSTITSPAFSELVIVLTGDAAAYLPHETMLFKALRSMDEARSFKLVFSFEGPNPRSGEARCLLVKSLEAIATKGLLDFLDSRPPSALHDLATMIGTPSRLIRHHYSFATNPTES